jgi:hypothetical protein
MLARTKAGIEATRQFPLDDTCARAFADRADVVAIDLPRFLTEVVGAKRE